MKRHDLELACGGTVSISDRVLLAFVKAGDPFFRDSAPEEARQVIEACTAEIVHEILTLQVARIDTPEWNTLTTAQREKFYLALLGIVANWLLVLKGKEHGMGADELQAIMAGAPIH